MTPMVGTTIVIDANTRYDISPDVWRDWETRFLKVVLHNKSIIPMWNDRFIIAHLNFPVICSTSKTGLISMMQQVFQDANEFMRLVPHPRAGFMIFDELRSSPYVKSQVKEHIALAKEELMRGIRVQVDHDCGLEVQFLWPEKESNAMYYKVGEALFRVTGILSHTKVKQVGTFTY